MNASLLVSASLFALIGCSTSSTRGDRTAAELRTSSPLSEGATPTRSATLQDPEGDIAPLVPCRAGEIEKRQSGKVVCVLPDRITPGSTMSGR